MEIDFRNKDGMDNKETKEKKTKNTMGDWDMEGNK